MNKIIILLVLMLSLLVALVSCQTQEANQFTDEDIAKIKKASNSYDQAALANDWPRWANHFTEDAVNMSPNQTTLIGRESILERVEARESTLTSFTTSILEIEGHGIVAFSRGIFSMTWETAGIPTASKRDGTYVIVWKKQNDGSWKIKWQAAP